VFEYVREGWVFQTGTIGKHADWELEMTRTIKMVDGVNLTSTLDFNPLERK
jgi:hypothetical protein